MRNKQPLSVSGKLRAFSGAIVFFVISRWGGGVGVCGVCVCGWGGSEAKVIRPERSSCLGAGRQR